MAKKLVVVQDECTSCGVCVETAPEVFKMNDKDLAEVVNQAGAELAVIEEAISSCPVSCIKWE